MSQNESKIIVVHEPADLSLITFFGLERDGRRIGMRVISQADFVLQREKVDGYVYRFIKNRAGGFESILHYPEFKQMFDSCPTARYVEDTNSHHCIVIESEADLIMFRMLF